MGTKCKHDISDVTSQVTTSNVFKYNCKLTNSPTYTTIIQFLASNESQTFSLARVGPAAAAWTKLVLGTKWTGDLRHTNIEDLMLTR